MFLVGDYKLGESIQGLNGLTEFSAAEYAIFRRKFEDEKNSRLLCELTHVSYEAFLYSETCKYLDVIYFTFRIIFVSFGM